MIGKVRNFRIGLTLLAVPALTQSAWAGPALAVNATPGPILLALAWLFLPIVVILVAKAATVAFSYCVSEYESDLFRRGRAVMSVSPVKSFFVGLVNFLLAFCVGAILVQSKVTGLLGILVLLVLLAGLLGSRALAYQQLGMRLVGDLSDPEAPPAARTHFYGGAALELAFLTPFVGQVMMIAVTLTTFGALTLATLNRKRTTAEDSTAPDAP